MAQIAFLPCISLKWIKPPVLRLYQWIYGKTCLIVCCMPFESNNAKTYAFICNFCVQLSSRNWLQLHLILSPGRCWFRWLLRCWMLLRQKFKAEVKIIWVGCHSFSNSSTNDIINWVHICYFLSTIRDGLTLVNIFCKIFGAKIY